MGNFQNQIGRDVVSPPARLQFPSIAEPDVGRQYSDNKYKATFLFHKTETDFAAMREVVEELSQQAFGRSARELRYIPFKDGDGEKESKWQGFPNHIFVVAKSKFPVDVWSPDKDASTGEIYRLDPKKLYAGCIVRAHFAPFAYMSGSDMGITFLLNFIQFLEDAPRFGGIGQMDARDLFSEYVPSTRTGGVTGASKPAAGHMDEDPAPEQAAQPAARRGRPAKAPQTTAADDPAAKQAQAQTAETAEETPSQRARRLGAEKRAEDAKKANGSAVDLPVSRSSGTPAPAAGKSSSSLMDMM